MSNEMFQTPKIEELEPLVILKSDWALISTLLSLSKDHGFGRLCQVADAIKEFYYDPIKAKNKYELIRKETLKLLFIKDVKRCIVLRINLKQHPRKSSYLIGNLCGLAQILTPKTSDDDINHNELVVFIPNKSIIPDNLLTKLNMRTVEPKTIAGITSDGTFYPKYYFLDNKKLQSKYWNPKWEIGDDVTEELGIKIV